MRTLLLLLIAVLCASGPYLYLTRGADARARRLAAATELWSAHDAARSLLGEDVVTPTQSANRAARGQLEANQAALDEIAADAAPTRPAAPPDVAQLHARAGASGVDAALTAPLLAGMTDGERDRYRRLGLGVVLDVISGRPHQLRSLSIANATRPVAGTSLRALRLELTIVSTPADVVALTETLIAGSETRPRGDIQSMHLTTLTMDELERLGQDGGSAPIQGRLEIDLLLARPRSEASQ